VASAASTSDKTAPESLVSQTRASFGRIDLLVCDAASRSDFPRVMPQLQQFAACESPCRSSR
jgi:NAD(P)-dependent dehydrogenase (short-subunit alcohol dehydrogenase family)